VTDGKGPLSATAPSDQGVDPVIVQDIVVLVPVAALVLPYIRMSLELGDPFVVT
jgi:hypothetical protein